MTQTKDRLQALRNLRMSANMHYAKAAEYFQRATRGMSSRHATAIGGTGHCPLSDYTLEYSASKDRGKRASDDANRMLQSFLPQIKSLPQEHQQVLLLFYDRLYSWEDVAKAIGRSRQTCWQLHKEALAALQTPSTDKTGQGGK
ncbi:MAG: hypothetical protein GX096_05185 [Clostridiales bacterium]|nr:hypothetical protein [Clostridiales bacterium]